MRKYLAATVVGAMLIAGQAAAQAAYSDSAMVSLGDRLGATSLGGSYDRDDRRDGLILLAAGAAIVGIVAWGFSQNGHTPESP
jgi:hypothetical protein